MQNIRKNTIKILTCLIFAISSISQVKADISFSGGLIYFDNSLGINANTLQLCARQGSWTGVTSFKNISNTKLYYVENPQGSGWGGILGWVVISANPAKSNDNFDNWSSYTWCTNWNDYGFNSGSTYLIVPSSTSKSQSVTTSYLSSGYSALNYTQTLNQALSTNNGSSYSAYTISPLASTLKVESYKLNSKSTSEKSTGSISTTCTAARTATVTYTVGSVNDGYSFVGWYEGTTKKSESTTYSYNSTAAKTITARFKANNYTITLNNQSATTAGTTSVTATYTTNTNLTTAITVPTRTGYLFGGYYTGTDGSGTQLIDASGNWLASKSGYTSSTRQWQYAGNITLYAKWTPITVSATLSPTSGTVGSNSLTFTITSNVPTSSGYYVAVYNFGEVDYEGGYINGDKLYSANPTTYTGTANIAKSGTFYTRVVVLKESIVQATSDKISFVTAAAGDPEWSMYNDNTKLGDFTNNGGGNYSLIITIPAGGYALTHYNNDQGAVCATGSETLTTERTLENNNGRIAWQDGAGTFKITIRKDGSTWKIKATKLQTTVTLNANSGTGGTGSITAVYGSTLPSFTKHTRTNYTLTGYYTATSGGTKIINTDGTLVANIANYTNSSKQWAYTETTLTLYAQWQETTHTVNVALEVPSSSAGTTSPNGNTQVGAITPVAITAPTPVAGYKATGHWTATAGITIANANNVSTTITATADGSVRWVFDEDLTSTWVVRGDAKFGNTWDKNTNAMTKKEGHSTESIVYFTANIDAPCPDGAQTKYNFKIYNTDGSKWYGLEAEGDAYWYNRDGGQRALIDGQNIQLRADIAGPYEIKVDYTTPSSPKITITFPTTYTVSYAVGTVKGQSTDPTATSGSSGSKVLSGTEVTFTAGDAKTGYTFAGWYSNAAGTGTALGTNKTYKQTINANTSVYAVYTENRYNVTVNTDGHGKITYNGTTAETQTVSAGISTASSTITAVANTGYRFNNWTIPTGVTLASGTTKSTAITIKTSSTGKTVTANYVDTLITISINSGTSYGSTAAKGLIVGNKTIIDVKVTDNVTFPFTVTFYDKDNNEIGNQTYSSGDKSNLQYTTPAWNTYAASTTVKAKITSGNVTSSKYSITTLYMKQPAIESNNKTTPLNLGAQQTISGGITNISDAVSSVEVQVTGPKNYSTTTAKTALNRYSFAFTPQEAGTYSYNVILKASDVEVARSSSSFTVSQPAITLTASPNQLLVDGDDTETTTLTATYTKVDPSATVTYTFKEGSTTLAADKTTNTQTYTPITVGTKDMTVTLNITIDGYTSHYTSSITKVYTKYYIHLLDNCGWGNIHAHHTGGIANTTWPGDNLEHVSESGNKYYSFLMNTAYTVIVFNGNNSQQTVDLTPNPATYPQNGHFYFTWKEDKDGKKYYTLTQINTPTVTLHYSYLGNTYATMTGRITNFGNYGSVATQVTECGFTVKDNVTNTTTDYAACDVHSDDEYFEYTLQDLVPGRSYTISAWARHCELKGVSATTTETTKTGSTLVKVKNDMKWNEVNLYAYYKDNKCSGGWMTKTYEMTPLGSDWFYAYVDNDFNYFQLNDGSVWANNETGIEATCYTNKASGTDNRIGKISCSSLNLYQVEIQENGKTYHSNVVSDIADTLSFYASKNATVTLIKFSGTGTTRTDISSNFSAYATGDVFIARVSSTTGTNITGLAPYTGAFYVRTDGKTSTWDDYKEGKKTMIKFENHIDLYPNEYYNHYWCDYFPHSINIKAQLANDYNENISVTLPSYILPKQSDSDINWGTNVRFAFNNTNNLFEVKRLQAANLGDFLQVYGYANGGENARNYAFQDKAKATQLTAFKTLTMSDLSDWMYQADFYVSAPGGDPANVVIRANYFDSDADRAANRVTQIYLGSDDETEVAPFLVMGETTTAGIYLVRVVYDYKTNRLVAAWLPYGDDLPGGVLDANMMIIRSDDQDAKTVGIPSTNRELTDVHKIYGVLEINRDEYLARKATGNLFYWISLPFDVKVKDIFGIDGFKTKWAVQRYRGDLRAQNGYNEGHTFWRNMNANETATMEAGRGYVIYLNLENSDFSEVSYIDDKGKEQKKAMKRLFFPSDNLEDFIIAYDGSVQTSDFPTNICTIKDREKYDSNWYVAGVKGYNNSQITNPLDATDAAHSMDSTATPPRYFYEWQWVQDGNHNSDNYTPHAVSGYTFKPFQSYMFQFAGTITWGPADIITSKSMPMHKQISANKEMKETLFALNFENDYQQLDNTFITLTTQKGITEDFDLNSDLAKIVNVRSQIYTFAGKTMVAGNTAPYDTEIIPLGVKINEDDNYYISLDNIPNGKIVYLVDRQLGTRTCLNYNDFDITLNAGTYNNRFVIELAQAPEIATEIDNYSSGLLNIVIYGNQLYVEGVENGALVNLYDMAGKQIISTRYNAGSGIPLPAQGIYMLSTNGNNKKVIIK